MKKRISRKTAKAKLIAKYSFKNNRTKHKIIPAKNYNAIALANNKANELQRAKIEIRRKKSRRKYYNKQTKNVFDKYRDRLGNINKRYLNAQTDEELGIYSDINTFKTAMKAYGISAKELAASALDNIRTSGTWLSKEDAEKIYDRIAASEKINSDYGSINNYSTRVYYRPLGWNGNDYAAADITFRNKGRDRSISYIQDMPKNQIMAMLIDLGLDKKEAETYIGY